MQVKVVENKTYVKPRDKQRVVVTQKEIRLVTIGIQGARGVPGLDGGSDYTYVAGESISALKACYYNPITNKVLKASNSSNDQCNRFVGVSIESAVADANIRIKRGGVLEDSNWSWNTSIDPSLYLSTDGTIVQSVPSSGTRLKIGFVLTATKIFINVSETIILI